jgi:APA family basic amino acid/polyamine antiporter
MDDAKPARLGMLSLVCLVIGNMIGTGVYVSSGYSLHDLGDAKLVLWVWLIAGVHALFGAIAYAAVIRRLPISGGEYTILSRWAHPAFGFLAGWISIIAGFASPIAINAKLMAKMAIPSSEGSVFSQGIDRTTTEFIIAVMVIVGAATLHWIEIRWNAWVNNAIVVLKLCGFTLFLMMGLYWTTYHGTSGITTRNHPGESNLLLGFLSSLYYTALAYTGFNASIYLAGEIASDRETREEQRSRIHNISRSMVIACFIVFLFYMSLNYVFLYSIPADELVQSGEGFVAVVAKAVGGEPFEGLIRWLIILSTGTSVLAMTMTGPQVYAQMGRDYNLSKWFASDRSMVRCAIFLQTILALLILLSSSIRDVASYLGLTLTVCGAMAISSLWLSKRHLQSKEWIPLAWWEQMAAAGYVLGAGIMFATAYRIAWVQFCWCLGTFLLGGLFFTFFRRMSAEKSQPLH